MATGAQPWLRTRVVAANWSVSGLKNAMEKGGEVEDVGGSNGLRVMKVRGGSATMDRCDAMGGRHGPAQRWEGVPPWTRAPTWVRLLGKLDRHGPSWERSALAVGRWEMRCSGRWRVIYCDKEGLKFAR